MLQFRNTIYYIDNDFNIINIKTNKKLKPYFASSKKSINKYLGISLYINDKQKNILYHRIIAEVFVPNPLNLPTVNHKNGNTLYNHPNNLEWVSYSENNLHAIQTGLRPCKLNQTLANEIREKINNGITRKDIMKEYNIGQNILSKIINNISWKN
jgi:hypothetical protein